MLTHEFLLANLNYEPNTGVFTWLTDGPRRKAGDIAGKPNRPHPYRQRSGWTIEYWVISIGGKSYFRSKLAWFYMTGIYPDHQIDHADTHPQNDRWLNLRAATQALNNANRRTFKNNCLRKKGVHPMHGKFRAMISIGGKNKHLGYFDTVDAASRAYEAAAKEAFGEFSRIA